MDSRKIVYRETGIIAVGQIICLAVMYIVFALLGYFDRAVLLGGIIGTVLSLANFFFMAVSASLAADKAVNQDVKSGTALMKGSYLVRLAVIFVILLACVKSGLCNPIASVLPLVFVRPIITVAEFFRKTGDEKA
ncbi:MAG: ATP synthase subunit I [Clostridia bacterium]|nr:ATP synthase subunit I [Clostridia bacterium]